MIDRSVEVTTTAVSELRSSSAAGGPFGPSRPQSMITSRSTSPSRSKASAKSSQTPPKCIALPGLVKPGRKSRRLSVVGRQGQCLVEDHFSKWTTVTMRLGHAQQAFASC